MALPKKAVESEGSRFNWKSVGGIIIFIVILALLLIYVIPKVGSGSIKETVYNFATNIWDLRTGGI